MEHLTDFVFVSMGNLTLARRDSYLMHIKTGIKPNTLASLKTAPLQMATLFPDRILKRAEDNIANYKSKGRSSHGKCQYHPYERSERKFDKRPNKPTWKNIGAKYQSRKPKGRSSHYTSDQPRASSPINDNYCLNVLKAGLLVGSRDSKLYFISRGSQKDIRHSDTTDSSCKLFCCKSCTFCKMAFTKERYKSCCCKLFSTKKIKICERCFLCRSVVFCQTCNKCPTCSFRSTCRGKTAMLLENLGSSGCQFKSSEHTKTRLQPPLSELAKPDKVTNHHKLLCQSPQKPLPVGGITSAYYQK